MGFIFFSIVMLVVSGILFGAMKSNKVAGAGPIALMIGVVGLGVVTLISSLNIVKPGHLGFAVFFGNVQEVAYGEGMHFINPMASMQIMDGRQFAYDFASGGEDGASGDVISITADQNPLTVDVTFPISLNKAYAWKVFQTIGDDQRYRQALRAHARSAIRDAIAQFYWVPATTTGREEVAATMRAMFERNVTNNLVRLGFTEEEAIGTFSFMNVQLRKILPDQRVLSSIAEKVAADQDLKKQSTLTKIAEEIANRRAMEGRGVAKLFDALPEGFTPEQIATVLNALAIKERADAMLKAVETQEIGTVIFGDAVPSVSAE